MTDARELPDTAAAELALGVLDGDERASALRRVLAEPAFAAEVERWRDEFGRLFDDVPEAAPPPGLFERIEQGLDGPARPARRGWLWPSVAGLTSVAAAAMLVVLVTRPIPAPVVVAPPPTSFLAAALTPTGTGTATPMAAVYDRREAMLRLSPAAPIDAAHSAQLWVIGPDGKPYSLGLLRSDGANAVRLTSADRQRLAEAVVLAISIEPVGGSRTGAPTGPVVAKGTLSVT